MTHPTIAQVYARHLAAFTHRTPFGVLLQADREALVKATVALLTAHIDARRVEITKPPYSPQPRMIRALLVETVIFAAVAAVVLVVMLGGPM